MSVDAKDGGAEEHHPQNVYGYFEVLRLFAIEELDL